MQQPNEEPQTPNVLMVPGMGKKKISILSDGTRGKREKSNVQILLPPDDKSLSGYSRIISNLSAVSTGNKNESDKSDDLKLFPSDEIFIHHLLGGKYKFGDRDITHPIDNPEEFAAVVDTAPTLPPWTDKGLMLRGQKFAQKNFFGLCYAHLLALMLFLGLPENRRFLRYTGNSHTPHKAHQRYLRTILMFKEWYECTDEEAWLNSVHRVRKIHAQIGLEVEKKSPDFTHPLIKTEEEAKNLKIGDEITIGDQANKPIEPGQKDQDKIPNDKFFKDEHYWECVLKDLVFNEDNVDLHELKIPPGGFHFSQFDMSVTQWSFMALPILEPKAFWIRDYEDGDMIAFVHLWAVIGDVLGMEDEYNLCTATELEHCKVICHKILCEVFIPSLLKSDYETELMWKALVSGISKIIPKNLKVVGLFIDVFEKVIKVECPNLRYRHSWKEWFGELLDHFIFRPLLSFQFFRNVANRRLRAWIGKSVKKLGKPDIIPDGCKVKIEGV